MSNRLFLMVLVFIVLVIAPPQITHAQLSQPCAVNATWLTRVGTPNYVTFTEKIPATSVFVPLTRADNQYLVPSGFQTNQFWEIAQTYATTWSCRPRSASFAWSRANTNSGGGRIETSDDGTTWTTRASNTISVGTSGAFAQTITWTNSTNITYKYIRMVAGSSAPQIRTMYIDADDTLPTYTTPLKSSDQSSITTSGATVATAIRPFLPVHAPYDGTVTSITALDSDDCTGLGVSTVICATITQAGSKKVVLSIEGVSYTYIMVTNNNYISEGDNIIAGCIMGESTQSLGKVVTTIPPSYLTVSAPTNGEPCTEVVPPEDCLNDGLSNSGAWYKQGTVTWGDEVVLGAAGKIYQIITMPIDARSRLVVGASGGTMSLRLGNTISSFTLTTDSSLNQLDFAVHTPNLVDFWEVAIQNTGTGDVTITSVCVDIEDGSGDGSEDYTLPANRCYFRDFGLSDVENNWSITGGAEDGTGMVLIPNGGGIAQPVTLYPNEYVLSLDIGLWIDDDFDIDANGAESITVSYVFPLHEPPEYVDYPALTIGDVGDNQNYRISVTFTIEEETDGDFYIEIGVPDLAGLNGLSINRACLAPTNGDWGDNPPPDDGLPFSEACETISPPRGQNISVWVSWHWFNLSQFFECDLMATLNNTYGLLRWFQAMAMLFFNWLGDLGVWINGHVQNLIFAITHSDALREYQFPDDVPSGGVWQSGGFSGMSSIMSDEPDSIMSEDCNWYDVFCHGRNIVGGVVNFAGGVVTDVLSALVNFIGALLAQIVDIMTWGYRQFFEPIIQLWNDFWALIGNVKDTIAIVFEGENNLITMWNETEPITPPGLQDCSDSPETKTLCLIYWSMENTLLDGDWGGLIIPMLTSYLGILGLLIILRNFTALIETARNA